MRRLLPLVLLTACGNPAELDRIAPPLPAWCGGRGLVADLVGTCSPSCLPDEELFFVCSQTAGRIAHTWHGLTTSIRYGYSVEVHDSHCQRLPSAVWQLTLLDPQPTADSIGISTASTRYSDCQADSYGAPALDLTEMYYNAVPAGSILPTQ